MWDQNSPAESSIFINNSIPLQSFQTKEANRSAPTLLGPVEKYIIDLGAESLSDLEATRNQLHLSADQEADA